MKKSIIKISIIACLMLLPMLTSQMFAQAPPKPPASGGNSIHGASTDQTDPNAAPLDGGLSILLLMGAAYGGKKIKSIRKK